MVQEEVRRGVGGAFRFQCGRRGFRQANEYWLDDTAGGNGKIYRSCCADPVSASNGRCPRHIRSARFPVPA
ncbi:MULTISPECIES: hypothetical protein [Burkholderia]|uniref:hypothetical protein n=1 Tax=Burkholderia TaxID=32008 RepID=UPI000AA89E42|nr:hypothetical protein [Burkholderia pyrrocinia]TDA48326.1 hypothetical protein EVG18_06080 [Burkholderia pyrrocinia]